ncbi:MAG TPA: Gfo/Idh/MocA family oxidoreductase [bacterium]|nr:Gfo/Idh/MocA family oxidoreductase [bacterium]
MKKIRVAIIGVRGIGRRHARAVLAGGGRITACAARTRESAERFAEEFNVPRATTNALSLARAGDVDAAVICTPNKYHAPYALAFMEAGKDVLLEKPMAMNAREAARVAAAARRRKRVVLVGHMWRFADEVNWARGVVSSGAVGRVVRTAGYGVHAGWGPAGWFTQKRLAGGGALADMGIHAIDTARFILADPLPRRVYAAVGTHYGDYDVDDTGVVMITWDGGATSVIESGWRHPHADRPYAGTQVYGDQGYVAIFPPEARLSVSGHPGIHLPSPETTRDRDRQQIYGRQMEHFLACVRSRREPTPGTREGLVNMRIVDAAYRSSRTGRAVRL